MKLSLLVCRNDNVEDYSLGKRFRFAVVDLDKGKDYPVNFVCMLPMQPNSSGKGLSVFVGIFGDRSLEQARALLTGALLTEDYSEVKAEIERRLKLLDAKQVSQIECGGCGKLFQPRRIRRFKKNFCPECMKK
jgi:hypothetical protein